MGHRGEELHALLPPDRQDEAGWGDATEVVDLFPHPLRHRHGLVVVQIASVLTTLAQTVERIDVESLREPIERTGNGDEVDRLAERSTRWARDSTGRFSRFAISPCASHEPKTPLTVMRAELESALVQAGWPVRPRFRESAPACRRRSIGSRRSWTR